MARTLCPRGADARFIRGGGIGMTDPQHDERVSAQVGRYMGAGLTWAASTLVFLLVGEWLGERLGARSVGALIGAFAGAAAGFWWLVRTVTDAGGSRDGSSGAGNRK